MNLPIIQPRPTILPAKPADRIRDRNNAGDRRRQSAKEHEKKRDKHQDDGRLHVDEYC